MSLAGKTALVTGATGFLGSALARRLAVEGVQVKALVRRPGRDRYIAGVAQIEIVSGDILDADCMMTVTQGCDIVFHVAAALAGPETVQQRVNVDGTRHVMQAAEAAGVQRVVHVSSIAIYGILDGRQPLITEDTPPMSCRTPYNRTKLAGEAALMATAQHVPYTIIRPAMIYGPHSALWTRTLYQIARRRPTPFVGDGSGSAHPIYVDDVVAMMLVLAQHPAAVGQAFHCAPDPAPTWREFIGAYSALAGHNRWLALPPRLLIALGCPVEVLLGWCGTPYDVPQSIAYLTKRITYSMQKARERLGWQPAMPLADGVRACIPYLQQQGLLPR